MGKKLLIALLFVAVIVAVVCGIYIATHNEPQEKTYELYFDIADKNGNKCFNEDTEIRNDFLLEVGEEYILNVEIWAPGTQPGYILLSDINQLLYDESVIELEYTRFHNGVPYLMDVKIKLLKPVKYAVMIFEVQSANEPICGDIIISSVD